MTRPPSSIEMPKPKKKTRHRTREKKEMGEGVSDEEKDDSMAVVPGAAAKLALESCWM